MRQLRHSSDEEPGYTRVRRGKGWSYHRPGGEKLKNERTVARLNALAVPPAYRDVWYCRDENGHIQATGMDEKGRKQYRYHDDFRALAEAEKFAALADFGRRLPRIRRKVEKALRRRTLTRETVIAAIVRLLDENHLRIGNRQYARTNKSYGATTLTTGHVEKLKTRLKLSYRAKHGVERAITITDPALVRIVGECHELPGQHLFQYVGEDGAPRQIDSNDVNDFLKRVSRADISAKHFRTWGASAMAVEEVTAALAEEEPPTLKRIVEPVAAALGNTPAVTRSSYIHPAILDAVKERPEDPFRGVRRPRRTRRRMSREETFLLAFLDHQGPPPSWRRRLARRLAGR
ncbi:DNA topoisomerase IB [Sphingomicrobium arenosum]|uniref:DNA topoisomerase IB n=1 Tax=Sphingomicrobium arenosum TaxID=2233861 RepID=UPI002240453A|nr:DNA topoisomerase IB [Sphingomicrobium arenosum]